MQITSMLPQEIVFTIGISQQSMRITSMLQQTTLTIMIMQRLVQIV